MNTSPTRWLRKCARYTRDEYRNHGLAGAREGVLNAWNDVFRKANQGYIRLVGNPGHSIYEREWDVLLVLDACRVDLLREVAEEYTFIEGVGTFRSLASRSNDWMHRTFGPTHTTNVSNTAYITGNPFSRDLNAERFALLDEVWRYAWDEELHTLPARALTDRAIETWRQREQWGRARGTDRMIVHYMQPHVPFVPDPDLGSYGSREDFGQGFEDLWRHAGYTIPRERVWQAYRDNLRYVLDDINVLIENLDADRVVITADHGNAVGEFGIRGHPSDVLLPSIRMVPWVETSGTDTTSYSPTLSQPDSEEDNEQVAMDRLRDLGYA